jgi:hypothetical protein
MRHNTSSLLLSCVLLLGACNKQQPGVKTPVAAVPARDPVKEELAQLQQLVETAKQARNSTDAAVAAQALAFLHLEAQARYRLQLENSKDALASGSFPEENLLLREEQANLLVEFTNKKYHLSPVGVRLAIAGVSPLGVKLKEIVAGSFLPDANGVAVAQESAELSGTLNILKVYYASMKALYEVASATPLPTAAKKLSPMGVTLCDAILQLYAAKNFNEIAYLNQQNSSLKKGYKRSVERQKKTFATVAKAK